MGRRAGSRNLGYFYRAGRGWYTQVADAENGQTTGRMVPLLDEAGKPLKLKTTPAAALKAAYRRALTTPEPTADPGDGVTLLEVCDAYLAKVKAEGAQATYVGRSATLFDLCQGLPYRFCGEGKPKPKASDYIHKGFGSLPIADMRPIHLDRWLQAHPKWKGARRTKIQAVKRALNYGVEAGLIPANPIKGYKTPKQRGRVTYITPEQEKALCDAANSALALAIKVCIRTGARPGCEFAKLTAAHVRDHGERMEWIFKDEESKTRKLRTIRITDPEIIEVARKQAKQNRKGPIFRNTEDNPWTRELLTEKFRKLKAKVAKLGIEFDRDCCMYSCRHTYAKRVLQGFWSGKATNIETLAKLMGNSPEVCRDHYLLWCDSYSEPLWESA
jgi:integrase